jgi:hypothetical protein
VPISNPINITPDDIVYLSENDNIDVDTVISWKGNHIIEHRDGTGQDCILGFSLRCSSRNPHSRSPGLKTLHIIEGEYTGAEKCSPHLGNYKLSLEEVKKGEDQAIIHPSGAIYRKMKHGV